MTNPTLTRWIEALRSGNYKQGNYQLRNGDAFCCLGVLCDVVDPGGWTRGGYHHNNYFMPSDELLAEVGINNSQVHILPRLNDNEKWTFTQIADALETFSKTGELPNV